MDKKHTQYRQGIVIRKSSASYLVLCGQRQITCTPGGSFQKARAGGEGCGDIAVGDVVSYLDTGPGSGKIIRRLPRKSRFARRSVSSNPDAYAQEEVLVANISQAVIVAAAACPSPRWNMVDRYLVTAEAAGVDALICLNKADLIPSAAGASPDGLAQIAAEYRAIGYPVFLTSAANGAGLAELKAALAGQTSVLLGKSGVGKTSLLNALLPGANRRTGEVSRGKLRRGRHTTTGLELLPLAEDGYIIDTPGARQFGLWDIAKDELAYCFPEMRPFIGRCRFGLDCAHDEEPGCAIRMAVMAGQISPRRYKSYTRMKDDP